MKIKRKQEGMKYLEIPEIDEILKKRAEAAGNSKIKIKTKAGKVLHTFKLKDMKPWKRKP